MGFGFKKKSKAERSTFQSLRGATKSMDSLDAVSYPFPPRQGAAPPPAPLPPPAAAEEPSLSWDMDALLAEADADGDGHGADAEMAARVARAAQRRASVEGPGEDGPDPEFLAMLARPSAEAAAAAPAAAPPRPPPRRTGPVRRVTMSHETPNLTPSFAPADLAPAPPAPAPAPATPKKSKRKKKKKNLKFAGAKDLVTVHVNDFDWSRVNDCFFNRDELKAMGQHRFEDASVLRTQRRTDEEKDAARAICDLGVSGRTKARNVKALLLSALERDNRDLNAVSIRGIEHFVYPELQQEMIRRKKLQKGKVIEFAQDRKVRDPQGWKLAEHSRTFSAWARDIASEKAMRYCVSGAQLESDVMELLSQKEQTSVKKGMANMDMSYRPLRRKKKAPPRVRRGGSGTYGSNATGLMVTDLHAETHSTIDELKDIAEDGGEEGDAKLPN